MVFVSKFLTSYYFEDVFRLVIFNGLPKAKSLETGVRVYGIERDNMHRTAFNSKKQLFSNYDPLAVLSTFIV